MAERRKNKKLSLMYKIVNNEAPLYLSDLLPRRVEAASNYNIRNSQNFEIPFTRLCSFETSFFPSTIRLWYNLDNPTRNATSLLQFKRSVRQPPCKPHAFMTSQHRKQDFVLTRLRNTLFLSSPHLCFIIVFICDLFVSRDDPLMSKKTFTRTEQLYVLSHDRSRGRGWDPVKPV